MLDPILWRNLPSELIQKIIEESEPSIDVQLYFKIHPKKIDEAKPWRLWYLLKSHDGIIYNMETESLHNFRIMGHHIVRRPIKIDWMDEHMTSFNQNRHTYMVDITSSNGTCISVPSDESWLTELQVLLKGSGLVPTINSLLEVL
jgi:hypothetical protein